MSRACSLVSQGAFCQGHAGSATLGVPFVKVLGQQLPFVKAAHYPLSGSLQLQWQSLHTAFQVPLAPVSRVPSRIGYTLIPSFWHSLLISRLSSMILVMPLSRHHCAFPPGPVLSQVKLTLAHLPCPGLHFPAAFPPTE